MKKSIFSIILIVFLTSVIPAAKGETLNESHKRELTHFLTGKKEKTKSTDRRLKKRKLKKAVRKTARIYREVKSDRENKKKSRNVQRSVRRIINIF